MNPTDQPSITHTTAEDGAAVTLIPVAAQDRPAVILRADFEEFQARGLSFAWEWVPNRKGQGRGYVRMPAEGAYNGAVSVARVIARGGRRNAPKHTDGDLLNLRRDNLSLIWSPIASSDLPPPLRLSGYREFGASHSLDFWERKLAEQSSGKAGGSQAPTGTVALSPQAAPAAPPSAPERPRLVFPGEHRRRPTEPLTVILKTPVAGRSSP
jgi:hypothetical protein